MELKDVIQIRELAAGLFALTSEVYNESEDEVDVFYVKDYLERIEEAAKALWAIWLKYEKDAK